MTDVPHWAEDILYAKRYAEKHSSMIPAHSDSDDFAQYYCEGKLKGRSQPVPLAFIDFLRQWSGKKTGKFYELKKSLHATADLDERRDGSYTPQSWEMVFKGRLDYLSEKERVVLKLYVKWEMSYKEIGDLFNVCTSRAFRIADDARKKVLMDWED